MKDYRLPFDDQLYHGLNSLGLDWLDSIFVAVSEPIFGISVAVVMLLWVGFALRKKALRPLLQVAAAIMVTDQLGVLLKEWFGRIRPCYALEPGTLRQLCHIGHTGSMPSLHSANSFAFAFALGLCVPGTFRYTLPLATLIAVSRVGVGVHWPSDILAGAIYGALVGFGVDRVGAALTKQQPQPLTATTPPERRSG